MQRVLFLGLGHLGQYFATEAPSDWNCFGTYRTEIDHKLFKNFQTFRFDSESDELFPFDKNYDYIVWSFPPFDDYPGLLNEAHEYFSPSAKWIYIGSTGVYSEGTISEASPHAKDTFRQKRLALIEATLKTINRDVIVIRPSGLVDEQRNPKTWFDKKTEISSSLNRVNWVYTKDVARFIVFLITNRISSDNFNLSASDHPVKQDLYREILGEELWKDKIPDGKKEAEKIILNDKSKLIGFKYLLDKDIVQFFK